MLLPAGIARCPDTAPAPAPPPLVSEHGARLYNHHRGCAGGLTSGRNTSIRGSTPGDAGYEVKQMHYMKQINLHSTLQNTNIYATGLGLAGHYRQRARWRWRGRGRGGADREPRPLGGTVLGVRAEQERAHHAAIVQATAGKRTSTWSGGRDAGAQEETSKPLAIPKAYNH